MLNLSSENLQPPPHLSPSSLATFEQCPLKFKFSKIDLIPDASGKEALMGNFVHDVLEIFYSLPPDERTVQYARIIAADCWANKGWGEKITELLRSPTEIKKIRWQAWFCIENLWLVEDPKLINPVGIEHELNSPLEGVVLKGFIDRYSKDKNDGLVISDYKTGKTPNKLWLSDKFEQLRIYAALMNVTQSFRASTLELIYLKDGVKFTEEVTDESITSAIDRIKKIKTAIDDRCVTKVFEPKKSKLCDYCSYKSICPAWSKKL